MIDVVMITTGRRRELLYQSVSSLFENAADKASYRLTIVRDGYERYETASISVNELIENSGCQNLILNCRRFGASASRNIGAGSIPKYRRGEHVLFLDDDVWMAPGWDKALMDLALFMENPGEYYKRRDKERGWLDAPDMSACQPRPAILSGYSHPFNHCEMYGSFGVPLVISSVCMFMPWSIFDDVGPWDEPGGPGGSEDYALCMRAKAKGYGFAVTHEQCCIHTGLTSSKGDLIVGYDQLVKQNERLMDFWNVKGRVDFK